MHCQLWYIHILTTWRITPNKTLYLFICILHLRFSISMRYIIFIASYSTIIGIAAYPWPSRYFLTIFMLINILIWFVNFLMRQIDPIGRIHMAFYCLTYLYIILFCIIMSFLSYVIPIYQYLACGCFILVRLPSSPRWGSYYTVCLLGIYWWAVLLCIRFGHFAFICRVY